MFEIIGGFFSYYSKNIKVDILYKIFIKSNFDT